MVNQIKSPKGQAEPSQQKKKQASRPKLVKKNKTKGPKNQVQKKKKPWYAKKKGKQKEDSSRPTDVEKTQVDKHKLVKKVSFKEAYNQNSSVSAVSVENAQSSELKRKNSAYSYLMRHGSSAALISLSEKIEKERVKGTIKEDDMQILNVDVVPDLKRQLSKEGHRIFLAGLDGTSSSRKSSKVLPKNAKPESSIGFQKDRDELQRMIEMRLAACKEEREKAKTVVRKQSSGKFKVQWQLPSEQKVYFNYTAMNVPKKLSLDKNPFPAANYDAVFEKAPINRHLRRAFSKGPETYSGNIADVAW